MEKNVLDYFNGRIASEIRLPEAIERKLLCPFQYFGVSDDVDLSIFAGRAAVMIKLSLTRYFL